MVFSLNPVFRPIWARIVVGAKVFEMLANGLANS